MATEEQIQAAKAELAKRRVEAAKTELARRGDSGIMETIGGIVEPVAAIGSGMAADVVGGIAGLGQIPLYASGLSDTPPENIVRTAQQAFTYQPRTETAKRTLGKYGEILQPLVQAMDKTRTGDKTLEATGSPAFATVNEMAPDIVMAMLGAKGLQKPVQMAQRAPGTLSSTPLPVNKGGNLVSALSGKGKIRSDLLGQKPIARSAKYTLSPKGAVTVDKLAKSAVGQGWDESFIAWAKAANKPTRQNLREMVNIVKKRVGETKDFSSNARPSDVLGKSLKTRIDRVKQVQRQSGSLVDKVAKKQLAGKQVDISGPLDEFRGKVMELGGRINDKGKLEFGIDSPLYGQASKQKALRTVIEKIDSLGDVADGYNAHKLKQFITEFVDYGKGSKEGLSANVENILKKFRSSVNETLKGQSPAYDKVNTAYSETTQALADFQQAAGRSIDLFGPESDAATGRVLRKLLSNMQNRENLAAAMARMEEVATKNGGKYVDDLTAQAKAVNEIERLMGSFAETSFKGEITSAGQRIAESPSARQLGTEAVRLSANKLRKMRQNQTKQIKSLEELLYQGGN